MNLKPTDKAERAPGRHFNGYANCWKQLAPESVSPEERGFETEGDAIESGLKRTIARQDAVMRSLIRAVYRFRDATLVDEKKDDFGSALQNLYRELDRAEDLAGQGSSVSVYEHLEFTLLQFRPALGGTLRRFFHRRRISRCLVPPVV